MYSMYRLLNRYSNGRWKEGDTSQILSHKVKGQPSCNLWVALSFWREIFRHLDQCYLLLCTHIQDDERKTLRTFYDKVSIRKVSKYEKKNFYYLLLYTPFWWWTMSEQAWLLYQFLGIWSGRDLFLSFYYQCLMIFRCFRRFSLHQIGYFTFIISGNRGIK